MGESDLTSFLNDLSSQAAAWYQGVTGTPVVVPGTIAAATAQTQLQAQTNLSAQAPLLGGIFSNPIVLVLLLGFAAFVIWQLA